MNTPAGDQFTSTPLGSWIGAVAISTWLGCGLAYGQSSSQCCNSVAPEFPAATPYGSTMSRNNDPRNNYQRYTPMPIDAVAPASDMYLMVSLRELRRGPYAPELVAELRGLGAALFQEEEFHDAIDAYRRAIHLLRINEGLQTSSQAGLVEQVIEAQVAVGDFIAADGQQEYLFRIRRATMSPLDPDMLTSVEQIADWHRGAYLGQLDKYRYPRIVDLLDLYSEMIDAVASEEGEFNRNVMPYLQGKLKTEYLLSVYPGEKEEGLQIEAGQKNDIDLPDLTKMRFMKFRNENYRLGHQTIRMMGAILENDPETAPQELADIQLALADWFQWHRYYAQAIRAYSLAWKMMAEEPGGADWLQANFESPLELPSQIVFQPGRMPLRLNNSAQVTARFAVSRHGKAEDIDILSPQKDDNQPAVTRGYKYLRDMRFRPRLLNGEVVAAKDLERTYNIRY
jgi:tetratricopeptide (TPR) repeat protein